MSNGQITIYLVLFGVELMNSCRGPKAWVLDGVPLKLNTSCETQHNFLPLID